MGDGRPDVQPGLEHDRHLVPGLVHLAAVDAPQRQQLEDDRVDVERDLPGRDAEDARSRRRGPSPRSRSAAPAALPDISSATSNPSTMPSSAQTSRSSRSRGSTAIGGAHPHGELSPVGVRLADHDVARAGVADDRGRHQPDRARRPRSARPRRGPGTRARCGPRCRTGRRSRRSPRRCRPVVPDVGHRQGDVLGEGRRPDRRRGRWCWRTGGDGRRGNVGSGRRRRGPRR